MDFGGEVLLIAVTGYGSHEDIRIAKQVGFDFHFVKPADPKTLLSAIAGGKAV